jgi:hypothetical protein
MNEFHLEITRRAVHWTTGTSPAEKLCGEAVRGSKSGDSG